MDVDRRVDHEGVLDLLGDRHRVALGVRVGEFAAEIAGAGHEPGPDRGGSPVEADGFDLGLHSLDALVRHTGEQQILPHP